MTLIEKYALIGDPAFFNRVRMAALQTSHDVLNDPNRTDEYEYAHRLINNPLDNGWLQPMVGYVLQNPTIATNGNSSTDNDIQFVVNSLYPTFSAPQESIS